MPRVYIFSRNKQTGKKRFVKVVFSEEEAREICLEANRNPSSPKWLEFTLNKEMI